MRPMQAEVDLLLTSHDLYQDAARYFWDHDSFEKISATGFQVGGTRFRFLAGEERETIEGRSFYQTFRQWLTLIAFLDDSYEALQAYAVKDFPTIWLNKTGAFAPSMIPRHDGDILTFQSLVKSVPILQKPSLDQCLRWWDVWEQPDNIRRHEWMVAWGAYVMAVMLRNKGVDLDPILTHRGGLLHDIDKLKTLDQDGQHGQMGADYLYREGYPALSEIVRGHIMHTILEPGAEERPWEVKLVYFMDKLVEGDQIVPFDERQAALKKRYPKYQGVVKRAKSKVWALNDEICSILSIPDHQNLISLLIRLQNT